jgi:hypothetical protein
MIDPPAVDQAFKTGDFWWMLHTKPEQLLLSFTQTSHHAFAYKVNSYTTAQNSLSFNL